jgi:hypothetical protein
MTQPFPQLNSPMVDAKTGHITPVWRALITSMWQNLGGASGSVSAPAAGNANQTFNVAAATNSSNAVNLSQADGRYAALAGSQTQSFYVGNAAAGSNQALRRSQCEGLFVAFLGAGAPIVPVTVTASPFAYTATTAGTLCISGGTISATTLTRGSAIPIAAGNIPVRNGDVITVTYSVAPTMNFIPA